MTHDLGARRVTQRADEVGEFQGDLGVLGLVARRLHGYGRLGRSTDHGEVHLHGERDREAVLRGDHLPVAVERLPTVRVEMVGFKSRAAGTVGSVVAGEGGDEGGKGRPRVRSSLSFFSGRMA